MINVSWLDAQKYIDWLTNRTGQEYRLPSEAEFEYAARGGTNTRYYWGDWPEPSRANLGSNITTPVGTYPPNDFGLYDMIGNVWEWTADCWHPNYENAPTDGKPWGRKCGELTYIVRGGSWHKDSDDQDGDPAARVGTALDVRASTIGFRVARTH